MSDPNANKELEVPILAAKGKRWSQVAGYEVKAPVVDDGMFWQWNSILLNGKNAPYSKAALAKAQTMYPEFFPEFSDGLRAHFEGQSIEQLRQFYPKLEAQTEARVIESAAGDWSALTSELYLQVERQILNEIIEQEIQAQQAPLSTLLTEVPESVTALREQLAAVEKNPPFLGFLTPQHSQDMADALNAYTAAHVASMKDDFQAVPERKQTVPFHLGGQPFWGVNDKGEMTDIEGYEILLRYASIDGSKMHVAPAKTMFMGINPGMFKPKGHHQQVPTVAALQKKQILDDDSTNACNFILFQAYWARNLLIQGKGKITFISFNIRADEYVLQCDGKSMEAHLLEIAQQVKEHTGGKSYIVYEATEYAPWDASSKAVLKSLVSAGVHIWIDDVLIKADGNQGAGFGFPSHSTTDDVALQLIEGNMATGHKFGQPLSSQLTKRGLDRFDLQALKEGELPKQFGDATQYNPNQAAADEILKQKAKLYFERVQKHNAKLPLVIECSATAEQLKTFLVGALGPVDFKYVYVQGGDSADYAVDFHDLRTLHKIGA